MLLPFLIMGCGGEELSQAWQLDRTRILAVRPLVEDQTDSVLGTRAEPRPGDTVSFEALTYSPDDQPVGATLWTACLIEEAIGECSFDEEELDETGRSKDGAGLIGLDPLFKPTWTIPEDALDSLSDAEQQEGLSALVNVISIPEDVTEDKDWANGDADISKELDTLNTNDFEIAFKRLPVSQAETPNHNPDIIDVVISGIPIGQQMGFTARTKKTYIIEPILGDNQIETYAYYTNEGKREYRTEEPFFSWYTELGADNPEKGASFDQPISLYPYSSVEWTAPTKPGWITIHIVVRDRRGGMGWRTLAVNVL